VEAACGPGPSCPCADQPEPPSGTDAFAHWLWFNSEYLLWWTKNGPLPVPLVTTSSAADQGVLGRSSTKIVFGDSDLDYRASSGARFTLGGMFNCNATLGAEVSGMFLGRSINFATASTLTGTPVVARPFINALTGAETAELVAAPGQVAGVITIHSSSDLYGGEGNLVGCVLRNCDAYWDAFVGFRFQSLRETLDIASTSGLLSGTASFAGMTTSPPALISVQDRFETRNNFYGGQIGTRLELYCGGLFVNFMGKLALGSNHESVNINGSSTLSSSATQLTVPGGLLAVSSNNGQFNHDSFAVIPEFGINVGYQFWHYCRVFVGYQFLYWSDVVRPGQQINRTVNPTLVPTSSLFGIAEGPAQPLVPMVRTDYWAQGLNFGIAFRY
jgi:hypothetical protein